MVTLLHGIDFTFETKRKKRAAFTSSSRAQIVGPDPEIASSRTVGQCAFRDTIEQSRQRPVIVRVLHQSAAANRLLVLGANDPSGGAFQIGDADHVRPAHVTSNGGNGHDDLLARRPARVKACKTPAVCRPATPLAGLHGTTGERR